MESAMGWRVGNTWFELAGDGDETPVIVVHGGPGATHDEVNGIARLLRGDRKVAVYDQVGNGRSSLLTNAPSSSWTLELFLEELANLITHLGFTRGYHLVGHSWGGMLALEHALTSPPGLRSLVLADTHSSLDRFGKAAARLYTELPDPSPQAFAARHICRLDPVPAEVQTTAQMRHDHPHVFEAMSGSNPFEVTGALKGWDVTERLPEIVVPTLVVSGAHDVVTPDVTQVLVDGLNDARWVLFENSSHMPFVEEPQHFGDVVSSFLREQDHDILGT